MRLRNYLLVLATGATVGLGSALLLYRVAEPFCATKQPDELADIQIENPRAIVLPFDLRYNLAFKIRRLETENPDIAWFGTSRVGSAMADMFKPRTFYNMAFTAWTTDQLAVAFDKATERARPKVAIISLDYFLFTDRWEEQLREPRTMIVGQPLRYLKSSLGNFAQHALKNWSALNTTQDRFIGPQTIVNREGFRSDGSWLFTEDHLQRTIKQYRNVKFLLDAVPGGPRLSERQKRPIGRMAALAKERNIKLIAVQLPYLREAVDFLDHTAVGDDFFGVWHDFESQKTGQWLQSLGIELIDLARSQVGADPDNFIDAYHPSERGMEAFVHELMQYDAFRSAVGIPAQRRGPSLGSLDDPHDAVAKDRRLQDVVGGATARVRHADAWDGYSLRSHDP
jgi:hypothetical protein